VEPQSLEVIFPAGLKSPEDKRHLKVPQDDTRSDRGGAADGARVEADEIAKRGQRMMRIAITALPAI
jgi:hypothetical protein